MSSPNRALPAAVAVLTLLGFAPGVAAGSEPSQETPAPVTPRPLKRLSDPYVRLPEVKIVPGAVLAAPPVVAPEAKGLLVLPKMTVNGAREKVPHLPRIFVQPPARNVPEPANPDFETAAGRSARLIKKHITGFDQALNAHPLPLIGTSLAAKAEQAEAREAAAKQLNTIADLLELSLLTGTETPEEQKKLRAEYFKVLYERPR